MRFAFVLLLASVAFATKVMIPFKYPLYKQCDPFWADIFMNGTRPDHDTICATGCAMSSVAMALSGKGLKMPGGGPVDPQTLNAWLQKHDGYWCDGDFCNNLVLNAPQRLFPKNVVFLSEKQKPSVDEMVQYVRNSNPAIIAHVSNNHHFVLVTGVELPTRGDDTLFYVHDPGQSNNWTRTYGEMTDLITYTIKP